MVRKYILLAIFLSVSAVFSQTDNLINQVQYGATLKAKIEFAPNTQNRPAVIFRLSSSFGVAGKWLSENIYPSVNFELQFYNGGLGSRSDSLTRLNTLDAILAFTTTAGNPDGSFRRNAEPMTRNVPLRYFADFAAPSMQNPYNYSVSLGTNLIWSNDGARLFQRVGFLNLNASGVQLSYYNDGTPFQYLLLGDGKDRSYTGGGVLSYNNGYGTINEIRSYSIEISYHKFTGFNLSSFELANSLSLSNVDYREKYQQNYNKSLWKFNFLSNNHHQGVGAALSFYNSNRFDGQHQIHWIVNNSFHLVPYKSFMAIEPSYYLIGNSFKRQ